LGTPSGHKVTDTKEPAMHPCPVGSDALVDQVLPVGAARAARIALARCGLGGGNGER